MWLLDSDTGGVKDFVGWDVSPGNVRSYGLVEFVDLNGDTREDFLCIANFSQHHEVLLNQDGKLTQAWHYGWGESVTTGKVKSNWPAPPYGDVDGDGDGDMEVVVSMFNSEEEQGWLVRIYDAVTGELAYRIPGYTAIRMVSGLDKPGLYILANKSGDPNLSVLEGAALFAVTEGEVHTLWESDDFIVGGADLEVTAKGTGEKKVLIEQVNGSWSIASPKPVTPPSPASPKRSPIPVPMNIGTAMPELLAADCHPAPGLELIAYRNSAATLLSLDAGTLKELTVHSSSCVPAIADLDGDGLKEIITLEVGPDQLPQLIAHKAGQDESFLWSVEIPATERSGLPQPRQAYIRTGYFTGESTLDLYVWVGTPVVRSMVIRGKDGSVVWEKGEMEAERYYGPSVNHASVWDYDGDGTEDLIFTNPDYYCVASGKDGELLLGPLHPPKIFNQPSQGLYTLPTLLKQQEGAPLVCLSSGHYFQGVMEIDTTAKWYKLPVTGENRCAMEGFLPHTDGSWRMGVPRQNGTLGCVSVADGTVLWDYDLGGAGSDVISLDVDGNGSNEFVVGTSHGELIAIRNGKNKPKLLWKKSLGGSVNKPIAADLNGDRTSELVVVTGDGFIQVLGNKKSMR